MDLFDVPPLRHARDLRKICGVSHLAMQPRTDTPAKLPDVVVSDILRGEIPRAAPDQPISNDASLVATAVRLAVENMTLEPARKEEISSTTCSTNPRSAEVRTRGSVRSVPRQLRQRLSNAATAALISPTASVFDPAVFVVDS
jgi:hypothetical protein